MTEHTDELTEERARAFIKECRELSDEKFMFIPGFEVPYGKAHVLMIGSDEFISQRVDGSMLLKWAEKAEFVILAHPHKNDFVVDETMRSVLDGVEVWNSQYDGKHAPRFRSLQLLKKLQEKDDVKAFAGSDLHREEHFGGPETVMEVDDITSHNILRQMQEGAYTIEKDKVSLTAKGEIKRSSVILRVKSFFSILFIDISKKAGKVFAKMGLSFPKKIKQKIRSLI